MAKNKAKELDKIPLKQQIFENTIENPVEEHLGKVIEANQRLYSDLVITGRAIPVLFDGLKPVQRRTLFSFKDNNHIGKYIKSARICGEILGKYHPHGDSSVYEALIEITQPFKNRFPFTIGQGNWGNQQNDSPAASRYTEITFQESLANLIFENLEKDNVVKWIPNYDDTLLEPITLPVKYPIALLNGSFGIAYAKISTNIPSFNIKELTNLFIYLIDNKFWEKENINSIDFKNKHKENILNIIPTVDMATGTNIYFKKGQNKEDIIFSEKYKFQMRASYKFDEKNKKIIFTNIPIGVMTDKIVEEIKNLGLPYIIDPKTKKMKEKTDESNILHIIENADVLSISSFEEENFNNDAEITVSFKKDANLELELTKIFKYTQLDKTFNASMTFIDEYSTPIDVSLFEISKRFLTYRLSIHYNAFLYDFKKIEEKMHLLNGHVIILKDIDSFIQIVKRSTDKEVYENIKEVFPLDNIQIEYLLSIQIKKLSKTGVENLLEELKNLENKSNEIKGHIQSKSSLYKYIKEDYKKLLSNPVIKNVRNDRISKIIEVDNVSTTKIDLIEDKDIVVMYLFDDTISYIEKNLFKTKNKANRTPDTNKINNQLERNLKHTISCKTKDELLLISNLGKSFKMKAYQLSKQFKFIGQLIKLEKNERIVSISKYDQEKYELALSNNIENFICITTKNGKTKGLNLLTAFNTLNSSTNRPGKVLNLDKEDEITNISFFCLEKNEENTLVDKDNQKILYLTNTGKVLKNKITDISIMQGNGAKAIKTIPLIENKEYIISSYIFKETEKTTFICINENGIANKTLTTLIDEKKKGQSLISFIANEKKSIFIQGLILDNEDEEMVMIALENNDILIANTTNFLNKKRTFNNSTSLILLNDTDFKTDVDKVVSIKNIKLKKLSEVQKSIILNF
jgi:DNA gyrase/topoisomerase IV subunit A